MSNITRLTDKPQITYQYQAGDITRVLTEGLRYDQIAAEIKQALEHLIFVAGSEDILAARELLSDLLHAVKDSNQPVSKS
ncbi:hypothetical protein [Marinobacter salexigens]|uniref:hypothetical protein n=1 Tax=Marinobacter salexigens TaxID=1925763 RepID=UPI000C294331|nr:hypothetical protein [Marinobacter salexigens]